MVEQHIAARGVRDGRVLQAMLEVPRERFVPDRLQEFAYADTPLPIEAGQTISQPYIVALMLEALELEPGDRALEVGAGSGYAAAVISRMAGSVFAIERHEELAALARDRLRELGYDNVTILHGDGTLGWPDHAPYDAIVVAAGGPDVPRPLLEQLRVGGRLVIPVGHEPRTQELVRVRRTSEDDYQREQLGRVQFVPLIGTEGWALDGVPVQPRRARAPLRIPAPERHELSGLIAEECQPLESIADSDLGALLERIGDARVVLIGEASHGTSEFYRMRARITRELIARRGFTVVAIEGDWPDTHAIDRQVRGGAAPPLRTPAFERFPTWMWRNREMRQFIRWLTKFNATRPTPESQVRVVGLDLYSLYNSIGSVLDYLDRVDPAAAESARIRYGCFSPWETDPATYGRAAVSGRMPGCEAEAVATLTDLLRRRLEYLADDPDAFLDAERNATVVRDAERYYRAMYYGSRESWNLRDRHMFDTLEAVLAHCGPDTRAVVWAHNSHVGNAAATEMGTRGELNIGQLARQRYGGDAYLVGFGTDHGTVAAASNWDEPVQFMSVRPAHPDSYERLCHESEVPGFMLHLRNPHRAELREHLLAPRLERAIGVIYRPETEMLSHYFQAALPAQFDEYVWFDETSHLRPLATREVAGVPETYPFAL